MNRHAQRGAAIISVLLTVTLATLIVSGLFFREHVTVRSVENRLALTQTRWVERAAIDWSKVILAADRRTGKIDHLGEPWAVPVAETRLDETVTAGARIDDDTRAATLTGSIDDAQSRINLNNLVTRLEDGSPAIAPSGRDVFRNLLDLLGLPSSLADTLAARLLAAAPPGPAAQAATLSGDEPELALPLLRVTDLRAVRGFDAETVLALEPFVTFLPSYTRINVNTASPEVLSSAVPDLDLGSARQLVSKRERAPFKDIQNFRTSMSPPPETVDEMCWLLPHNIFSERTDTIRARGVVSETLLEREAQKVNVIWQRRL